MGSQTKGKLNWLQSALPEGMVVDAGWLGRHGVSRQLRRKYVLHGWLLSPARGVYRRPVPSQQGGPLSWEAVVISLNALLDLPVSVGARTALELQGFSHYVAAGGAREAHLYSNEDLPGWVTRVPVNTRLVFHSALRLFKLGAIPRYGGETGAAPSAAADSGLTRQLWGRSDWQMVVSTPERAILELLDEIPKRETFHQADVLMEGLRNLSPRRLQALLESCKSVKVKRLFFWFAERHSYTWLQKLDRSSIDLGKGKRMVVRGGRLDAKYDITVPEKLDGGL